MKRNLKELEHRIGYTFQDFALLKKAMSHSSYVNEEHLPKYECNERLEFLGDAVLELVSSEFLFFEHPTTPEGELTKTRASMVCEPALAFCAREIELGEYLLLGKGEDATGGRKRESVTSDAMEALIGAIYVDGGFANAKEFINRFIWRIKSSFMIARLSCRKLCRHILKKNFLTIWLGKRDQITIKLSRSNFRSENRSMESEKDVQKRAQNRKLPTRPF